MKAAPVSARISANAKLREFIVHTGQHHDVAMSDAQFAALGLRTADLNLDIHGGNSGDMIGHMISALDDVIAEVRPNVVLVYGDANSTLAGAVAAANRDVPVAHVEAGLRSYDRRMPEERNRVVTDHLADLLFCPTREAVRNLAREGVTSGVHMVGDVMLDAFLTNRPSDEETDQALAELDLLGRRYVLATLHRAATTATSESLKGCIDYLRQLGATHSVGSDQAEVVMPLHPRTRNAIADFAIATDGIRMLDPLDYRTFSALLGRCILVATDSGGVQKEAYFHRIPCVTLRSETEWPETVAAGWNRLWTSDAWAEPRRDIADYGCGDANEKIVRVLEELTSSSRDRSMDTSH